LIPHPFSTLQCVQLHMSAVDWHNYIRGLARCVTRGFPRRFFAALIPYFDFIFPPPQVDSASLHLARDIMTRVPMRAHDTGVHITQQAQLMQNLHHVPLLQLPPLDQSASVAAALPGSAVAADNTVVPSTFAAAPKPAIDSSPAANAASVTAARTPMAQDPPRRNAHQRSSNAQPAPAALALGAPSQAPPPCSRAALQVESDGETSSILDPNECSPDAQFEMARTECDAASPAASPVAAEEAPDILTPVFRSIPLPSPPFTH
jgi:hypothetical protein